MVKILVVEDTDFQMNLIRDVLETHGYEVREAVDYKSALEAVTTEVPDLIILDWGLPDPDRLGLDGLAVLKELRKQHSSRDLPVIMLTAFGNHKLEWESLTSQADLFLDKPFDPALLIDWINRLVQGETPNQALEERSPQDRDNEHDLMSELRGLDNN